MDEIVIDERTYISSKRAAKLTGYAKDYIGQLCREGRVQARFVGRSWYVLESSLQDHRFGNEQNTQKKIESGQQKPASQTVIPIPSLDAPRYKLVENEEHIPVIHRKNSGDDSSAVTHSMENSSVPATESTWENWMDIVNGSDTDDIKKEERKMQEDRLPNVDDTAIYEQLSKEPASDLRIVSYQERIASKRNKKSGLRGPLFGTLVRFATVTVAIVLLSLAALNNGVFDKYIASFEQATTISGISIYIKSNK